MVTSLALVVCHDSVVDCPFWMVLGLADSEAVGAAGGGGGGGGGGAVFFLQAPSIMMAPSANTRVIHLILFCFTFSSLRKHEPLFGGTRLMEMAVWIANQSATAG